MTYTTIRAIKRTNESYRYRLSFIVIKAYGVSRAHKLLKGSMIYKIVN